MTSLVFDFDGTLATCPYDFIKMRQVLVQTAEEFGLLPEQLAGHGLLEMIELGGELLSADSARSAAYRDTAMRRLEEIEFEAATRTRLLPGVVEGLTALRGAGYRLGIVTRNSARAVTHIIGDASLPFDALLCREDVTHPKPHIEHARRILHLLDDIPVRAIMVGDHPTDITMGKLAGMGTVAVLTGQSSETDLRAADPDLVLPSVMTLTMLLLAQRR